MPRQPNVKHEDRKILAIFFSADPGFGSIFLFKKSHLSKVELRILREWTHDFDEKKIKTNPAYLKLAWKFGQIPEGFKVEEKNFQGVKKFKSVNEGDCLGMGGARFSCYKGLVSGIYFVDKDLIEESGEESLSEKQ